MFTANKFQFLGMITREYLAQILPETTVDNINNLFYIYIYIYAYIYICIYIYYFYHFTTTTNRHFSDRFCVTTYIIDIGK